MDIQGNKLANSLAKAALINLESTNQTTSLAVLGLEIKKRNQANWLQSLNKSNPSHYSKTFSQKIRSKIQIPPGTKRELSSSLFQLKLGHGYFKSYLYHLSHTTNNLYRCRSRETPEHLLLSYREYRTTRQELIKELNSNRLSLHILLNTKIGIEKTIGFLKKTRIATREQYTNRRSKEEEIGGQASIPAFISFVFYAYLLGQTCNVPWNILAINFSTFVINILDPLGLSVLAVLLQFLDLHRTIKGLIINTV